MERATPPRTVSPVPRTAIADRRISRCATTITNVRASSSVPAAIVVPPADIPEMPAKATTTAHLATSAYRERTAGPVSTSGSCRAWLLSRPRRASRARILSFRAPRSPRRPPAPCLAALAAEFLFGHVPAQRRREVEADFPGERFFGRHTRATDRRSGDRQPFPLTLNFRQGSGEPLVL